MNVTSPACVSRGQCTFLTRLKADRCTFYNSITTNNNCKSTDLSYFSLYPNSTQWTSLNIEGNSVDVGDSTYEQTSGGNSYTAVLTGMFVPRDKIRIGTEYVSTAYIEYSGIVSKQKCAIDGQGDGTRLGLTAESQDGTPVTCYFSFCG